MLLGISFTGNAEQNHASTAVDAAIAACAGWITVYPPGCPEEYFHLCVDNYDGENELAEEAIKQVGMRCN